VSPSIAIAVSLVLPLLGAIGVLLTGRWPNIRETVTLATGVSTFGAVCTLVPHVLAGERPALEVLEVAPGMKIAFEVEPLGMLFALVASGLWIVTSLYAIGYMRGHHEKNQTRFFVCFALAISAALGIAYSANLFCLFLFYETLTFSTYPLVTHHGTPKAVAAGRLYLGILVSTSVAFLLLAVIWTYGIAGTLDFKPGGILADKASGPGVALLLALFAFGTGKAALMPFHRWLPAAMVAPTPVSALLHAVAVVKAGVFTVVKVVVYVFGIEFLTSQGASVWLMWAASFTLLTSSVIALTQDNLKARLAYSTVSQLAYITLGAALASPAGVIGAGMHIAMHAMGKITLFFCAGALMVGAHKTEISTMDGIGRKMPFTMGAFFLGSLSIIGLPPMGGSWSKWHLALGAAQADQHIFIGVLMISSLLSIAYLMPVVGRAFFIAPPEEHHEDPHSDEHHHDVSTLHHWGLAEAPILCFVPPLITSAGCILLFVYADALYTLLLPLGG